MHCAPREEAELEGDAQHQVPFCGHSCWVLHGLEASVGITTTLSR